MLFLSECYILLNIKAIVEDISLNPTFSFIDFDLLRLKLCSIYLYSSNRTYFEKRKETSEILK